MPNKPISKRLPLAAALVAAVVPCLLMAGLLLGGRYYALVSTLVVLISIFVFFLAFERRKPKARELVPIAVMAALAAASRLAFAALPEFKPIVAVVIITALAFGPEAGFLTGAVSMLASNMILGQGAWTPWQMFCCGGIGFLAGLLRSGGLLKHRWSVCLFGFVSGYLYGMIIDIWTVSTLTEKLTWQTVAAVYAAGLFADTVLAAATAFFLFLLEGPMVKILQRIKDKYGLLDSAAPPE